MVCLCIDLVEGGAAGLDLGTSSHTHRTVASYFTPVGLGSRQWALSRRRRDPEKPAVWPFAQSDEAPPMTGDDRARVGSRAPARPDRPIAPIDDYAFDRVQDVYPCFAHELASQPQCA